MTNDKNNDVLDFLNLFIYFYPSEYKQTRCRNSNDTKPNQKVHEMLNSAPDFKCTGQDHCWILRVLKSLVFWQ